MGMSSALLFVCVARRCMFGGDCDATCAVSCAGSVDCLAKIHVSLIKTASDIAHRYSLIRYECRYGLQTMKENLMHIENRADVLCIQMIDTFNNL
jgi:hypothetical protein